MKGTPTLFRKSPKGAWHVRKQHNGHRRTWCTGTTSKTKAEPLARAWVNSLEKELTDVLRQVQRRRDCASIEEAIEAFCVTGAAFRKCQQEYADDYANSLRLMVRETGHGLIEPLTILTPDLVRRFYAQRIKGLEGEALTNAINTANKHFTQAKSLFGKRAIKRGVFGDLALPLADLEEFRGADKEDPGDVAYELPDTQVLYSILKDSARLREEDRAVYVCFFIALTTGMRRGEIINFTWSDIKREEDSFVAIVSGRIARTKNKRSRRIPIHKAVFAELDRLRLDRQWRDGFVVPAASDNDRKDGVWRRLGIWFKSHGWDRDGKAHELRKYFGAQVATEQGLFQAQKYLGHQSPQITSKYYAALVEEKAPSLTLPPCVESSPRIEEGGE